MYLNGLYESENLQKKEDHIVIQTTQNESTFFPSFFLYFFNILTKEYSPKFKKTFEKYTVSYYLQ